MKPKVIVLGPKSGIGEAILFKLKKNCKNFNFFSVVRKPTVQSDVIFWDYQSDLPHDFRKSFLVINCARSDDFLYNINFNRILNEQLDSDTHFINFSSNCIFATPSNYFSKFFFKGDAYIREKLAIEKMSKVRSRNFILRPTIVTSESNWNNFIVNSQNAEYISTHKFNNESKIKIITTDEVAEFVNQLVLSNFKKTIPAEIFSNKILSIDFISNKIKISKTKNIYFDNSIKNFITAVLTSVLIPNFLVYRIQKIALKKNSEKNSKQTKFFNIQGMTRLYLFGDHTL